MIRKAYFRGKKRCFSETSKDFTPGTHKDDYHISSGPSFRSAFVFSINSLILLGFPLTSFHLAEASRSAFLWLHTLVCAVFQKHHEISFVYTPFAINLFYLQNLKT